MKSITQNTQTNDIQHAVKRVLHIGCVTITIIALLLFGRPDTTAASGCSAPDGICNTIVE